MENEFLKKDEELSRRKENGKLLIVSGVPWLSKGLIFHSDRGIQYACRDYVALAQEYGMRISMSRKWNPYDNPIAEGFF
jgi:transposase InsO family protein